MAQFRAGIKGGINICDLIVTNSANYFGEESFDSRISYHIGTYIQHPFSEQFGLQVEVLFSNKGYKHKLEDQTLNVNLNYLNWPVLLVYRPVKYLEFEFGPEFGYLITGEAIINNFDFGVDLGARLNISKRLNLGTRYNNGVRFKMNIDETFTDGEPPKYSNSVFQFYIGYNFDIKVKNTDEQ